MNRNNLGASIIGKKVLVTGGAGFIGSHLTQELINLGAKVAVIDVKVLPKSIFSQNKLNNKVLLKLIDIRDEKKLNKFFSKYTPDYIFHLAAEPIVEKAFEDPVSAFDTNIKGTINLLEVMRKNKKIKGMIAASSDKAYGKTIKKYTEDSPLKGDHPYDVSKSCMDLICQTYIKTYNLPICITRFGNVYGEGDLYLNRIIPGICVAASKNKILKIRSNGKYVRDYLYVKDVVEGYLFLLRNFQKLNGQAFNFSSKDTFSVLELIRKAEKILGKKIKFKILNTAKNEIPYQHLNDNKVKKLGWKNKYNLESTLGDIVIWYKSI
jgi:CDP-glucose 4,6-dehydratase